MGGQLKKTPCMTVALYCPIISWRWQSQQSNWREWLQGVDSIAPGSSSQQTSDCPKASRPGQSVITGYFTRCWKFEEEPPGFLAYCSFWCGLYYFYPYENKKWCKACAGRQGEREGWGGKHATSLGNVTLIFIGARSDHSLRMSVTHWLTHWQTCWKLNELT